MELIVGKNAGFCYGVRRAVEKASECAERKLRCATLGPIIHNPQEVERLLQSGIRCISSPEEALPGETVLIRSHGVSPTVLKQIDALGLSVIDLTCPYVAHIHKLVKDASESRTVIIVGEAAHPEVQGIAGWARADTIVIATPEEAEAIRLPEKALVVAQTTLREETYRHVLDVLRRRVPDLEIHHTICSATEQRQREAEELSENADVTIVVGGHNSSNTQKLYETCKRHCDRTILIETPDGLEPGVIGMNDKVAVTAGASTPQWLLDSVCGRIHELVED